MPFPKNIREESLVRSQRHCCVCHEFSGRAINVHHIKQESEGGPNTLENSIVLCLRCHSEAGHFNPLHPMGTSYSPKELIRHRDLWWEACANGTAVFSSSVQAQRKEVYISQELHKYRLLMSMANGNQKIISNWKLNVFIHSAINVRVEDVDQIFDSNIDGETYQTFELSSNENIFPGEERVLLDHELSFIEYDIDRKIYKMAWTKNLNIHWSFFTDSEPVRKGTVTWEEMQIF